MGRRRLASSREHRTGLDAATDPLGPSELDDGELEVLEAASRTDGATAM